MATEPAIELSDAPAVVGASAPLRIALCSPSNPGQKTRRASSLGIRSLAAYLASAEVEVAIFDAHCWGWDAEVAADALLAFKPDIVGIQLIFYRQIHGFEKLLNIVGKNLPKGALWIAGGHVPTFSPEEILRRFPMLDLVIRGEGEIPLKSIVTSALQTGSLGIRREEIPNAAYIEDGQFVQHETADLLSQLDDLPFPTFLPEDHDSGPASIIGSRGCYATCEFCSVPPFFKIAKGPLWRLRSARNMADEVEKLHNEFDVTKFSFLDDIFLGTDTRSYKRAWQFADEIIRRDLRIHYSIECRADSVERNLFAHLKKSGLARVFVGFEAGSDGMLSRFRKMSNVQSNYDAMQILSELEISVGVGFIMFDPDCTLAEISENLSFLASLHILSTRSISNKMQAYPGTPAHARLLQAGRLFGDPLYPDYNFLHDEVSKFFKITTAIHQALDFVDIALLKMEYLSADNQRSRLEYNNLRFAFSNDLHILCDNAVTAIRSTLPNDSTIELARLREKWENWLNG